MPGLPKMSEFDALSARIDAVKGCPDLSELTVEVQEAMEQKIADVNAQMAPVLALKNLLPLNIDNVVGAATAIITQLTSPYVEQLRLSLPATPASEGGLPMQLLELQQKLRDKMASLKCDVGEFPTLPPTP